MPNADKCENCQHTKVYNSNLLKKELIKRTVTTQLRTGQEKNLSTHIHAQDMGNCRKFT